MKRIVQVLSAICCAVGGLTGCRGTDAPAVDRGFSVALHAISDEGLPVEGAQFVHAGNGLGTTDALGVLTTNLRGTDGQVLSVTTRCPDGYDAPAQSTQLRLTEIRKVDQSGSATIAFEATCTRKIRDVLLVVRADQSSPLPLEIAGKAVGQTDENGQVHVRLQLERTVRSLSVSLNTSGAPTLRPQNPSRVFELEGQDAVLLFEQNFVSEKPATAKRVVVARKLPPAREARRIPYRID